jgi:electron transfer flavoprotein beta subunit
MSLNIIVCIKSVVLDAPNGKVVRTTESCALNPFDRPVLETAIKLREEIGGKVTTLSMGPESGSLALYEALAMGVDQAVLISDPALAGSDTLATSTVLGAAIQKLAPFDLILFGTRTSDSDTGQVGPQTAVLLDIPLVTGVSLIELKKPNLIVKRKIDEFFEEYEVTLPGALTIHAKTVQARDASLMGIETAYGRACGREHLKIMTFKDLDIPTDQVGENGSPTKILDMHRITKKRKCEMIEGSVEEQTDALIHRLTRAGYIG